MAAAPPSPLPLKAHRDGGDAPVSLFVDTDLGTHLALLVAPDTAIHDLKSQVATEHAAAFPDLGPVAVKSFQVRRKGVLYHLSDSMTLTSAFTKIKGGCFLHVKMGDTDTAAATHCQDTAAINGRRLSDGHLGIHVKKRVQELPVMSSDIALDMLPQSLEGDDAHNVGLIGRDETVVKASGLPVSSSEPNDGNQGGKHVQFVSDTQASTDLISDQEKFEYALKGCRNPSIADDIYSTSEVVDIEGKMAKENCVPRDGGDKYEEIKQHNEGNHDEGVLETSIMEKDGKSTDALDKRQTNKNTSQEKKRKKSKKISSVGMASLDTTGEKEMHEYRENADTISTEKEIIHEPSMQQMPRNVYQGGSNIIENLSGDGKKKNKRRRNSKSSNAGFVTNESSIQCTDAAPIDAKQTTPEIIEETTVIQQKDPGDNVGATDVIDEVLADIRSKDTISKDLNGDMLTGQTHLVSNKNTLELPESAVDKLGVTAALPLKYPAAVRSDAPVSSPRPKKSKGRKSKVLSTMTETDSSHHSNGVPEEDAKRELNESDSLRFADKTNDHKDVLTGDAVMPADNNKATKRQRRKGPVKQALGTLNLKEVNAAEANLVQKGSVIDTPLSTVGNAEQKDMSSERLLKYKKLIFYPWAGWAPG